MDKVTIPDEQVVPIEDVAPGLRGLRIAFVNVFAVTHDDGSWTLVDAGLPFSTVLIRRWAEKNFNTAPLRILLTHGHFDHVGAAAELAAAWDVLVFAHRLELPYLTGNLEYPPPNVAAGGGMMSLLSPLYPREPIDLADRLREIPIADAREDALDVLPGWHVAQTQGHTPGHLSFFRPDDRVLIAGDAFCTTKPESFFDAALAQPPELHGPPSYFTSDWPRAAQSVRKLAALEPLVVAPGHGKPIAGKEVPDELQRLARDFDKIAVPLNRAS
jgi:glyoxylase-like metal-dependent hydrolase (beta-lactamase superfamily II)